MSTPATPTPAPLSKLQVGLILAVAVIGFAFDIYELLMLPLISGPAIAELTGVTVADPSVRNWFTIINTAAAITGGVFGLLGGYLIDRFGRKRILLASILLYGLSPLAAAFSTDIYSFMFFRCTTFIGVCVEFIAAVAWLAELFPEKKKRELVLGFTQAFSSFGGLMVAGVNALMIKYAPQFPALPVSGEGMNPNAAWRFTLISGLIPAIPILLMVPFLPESPVWRQKRAAGTLKRPSIAGIFAPEFRRTTVVVTILFACCYGAAFGAIQLAPNFVTPGLAEFKGVQGELAPLRAEFGKLNAASKDPSKTDLKPEELKAKINENLKQQQKTNAPVQQAATSVQTYQELGGLLGRVILAVIAMFILSRRIQLRLFLVPGIFVLPYVFWTALEHDLTYLQWGIFAAAMLTVAQYSYWGNYLPSAYPVHLRGTAGGFTANIGGRMIGSSIGLVTSFVVAPLMSGTTTFEKTSQAAAIVGGSLFVLALIVSFWLPEPKESAE